MMRRSYMSPLLLLPLMAWAPLQSTLEVDVALVNVFFTVRDAEGRYVRGLDVDDLRVFEDGVAREIEIFEPSDSVLSSIGILIDNSGSSADILDAIRSGVLDFASSLDPADEVFVMGFGTETLLIHDFGDRIQDLGRALDGLRSSGISVLFDALDLGTARLAETARPRKALIALTDGGDNGSERTYGEVVRASESRMVMLYFIGMGPPVLVDSYTLRGLASKTGGRLVLMSGDQSPRDALAAIREDLSRQYYLAYYAEPTPGYHAIRVEVPGTNFTVSSRDGYLVGQE